MKTKILQMLFIKFGGNQINPEVAQRIIDDCFTDEKIYEILLIGCEMEFGDLTKDQAIKKVRKIINK